MASKIKLFKDETPGIGKVVFDKGVKVKNKETEIRIAKWLIEKFGGEYRVLNESKIYRRRTPDLMRNNSVLIEIKTASTIISFKNRLGDSMEQLRYKNNKMAKISRKIALVEVSFPIERSRIKDIKKEITLRLKGNDASEIDTVLVKGVKKSYIFRR